MLNNLKLKPGEQLFTTTSIIPKINNVDLSKMKFNKLYLLYFSSSSLGNYGIAFPISGEVFRGTITHGSSPKTVIIEINKKLSTIEFFGNLENVNSFNICEILFF